MDGTHSSPFTSPLAGDGPTVAQMWATRPPRFPTDQGGNGKIAGVCEGISQRYLIDVSLVRILFIVATVFGGAGIPVYTFLWLVSPRWSVPVAPYQALVLKTDRPIVKKERTLAVLLGIALLIFTTDGHVNLLSIVDTIHVITSLLLHVFLTGLIWMTLHKRTPVPPRGTDIRQFRWADQTPAPGFGSTTGAPSSGPHPQQTAATGDDNTGSAATYPDGTADTGGPADNRQDDLFADITGDARRTPPSWDPLGAAPFAWDLPEPPPAPSAAPEKKHSPWVTLGWILGVALVLVSGFMVVFLGITSVIIPFLLLGCLLIVGLVARKSGKIAVILAGLLAVVALVNFAAGVTTGTDDNTVTATNGDRSVVVTDATSAEGVIVANLGDIEVDARALQPLDEPATMRITSNMGDARILVPNNVKVSLTCKARFGICNRKGDEPGPGGAEGELWTIEATSTLGSTTLVYEDASARPDSTSPAGQHTGGE
ncbi:PspC domain-containing protein [Corynebacterium mendelii]|uniref:PspC domain-containing protein n=1 Tax=Corynebacterium mendelii TaxID=2765362 RepID=A0A939DZE0_9CORY|nr:PspC domain-containing protein [Corynebacterium mendelii]MBN9644064.1 PspC domain-containing protein [Corynebacterium mendelii]